MELKKIIAENLKEIREKKKLTLDNAANVTGVSRSMLAQIEKGDVNPTISVLWKIANGYKVSFTSLIDNSAEDAALIRASDTVPLVEDEGRYLNYPVFPFQENRLFETHRIVIKPEGFLLSQPHMAGTEEYVTVFTGEVEISAGEQVYDLAEGDSLHFIADREHSYKNIGKDTINMIMLIYYGEN